MTSEKKIQANQRNAQHSTGPRSVSGQLRSRGNAIRSGLYARILLLPKENHREYQRLRTELFDHYAPVGPLEETLVQLVMDDMWRLGRLRLLEPEFLRQLCSKLKNPMRALVDKKESVASDDPGPALLEAYVPPGDGARMEEISRQRRLAIRDFFQNTEALCAMQSKRKAIKEDK